MRVGAETNRRRALGAGPLRVIAKEECAPFRICLLLFRTQAMPPRVAIRRS